MLFIIVYGAECRRTIKIIHTTCLRKMLKIPGHRSYINRDVLPQKKAGICAHKYDKKGTKN